MTAAHCSASVLSTDVLYRKQPKQLQQQAFDTLIASQECPIGMCDMVDALKEDWAFEECIQNKLVAQGRCSKHWLQIVADRA